MPPERPKTLPHKMRGVRHAPHLAHGVLLCEIVFNLAERYVAIVAHGAPPCNLLRDGAPCGHQKIYIYNSFFFFFFLFAAGAMRDA